VLHRHRSGKRHAGRKYFCFDSYVDTMYIYDLLNFCEGYLVEKVTFTIYAIPYWIYGSGIVNQRTIRWRTSLDKLGDISLLIAA
jgi:hypothetical protein